MAYQTSEQYRKAALNLANLMPQTSDRQRSVIVSSVSAGEGATTATVLLGRHLLQDQGAKPIVLELNHVRPALARMFGLDPEKSIAGIASGSFRVAECVQTDPTGLSMIPAGELNGHFPNLETLLCRMLQELRNHYDFILLDVPPVLESVNVMIAGRVVRNVVLVVGAGKSSQEAVREACRQLREARIEIVGTILNEKKRIFPRWLDRSMRP